MADQGRSTAGGTPPLEILLGVLGGGLVLALIGFLLVDVWRGEGRGQPEVRIELAEPQGFPHGWIVPFQVINSSRAPATQLRLEAELQLPDGRRERGEVVVDYLAGRSEQGGDFFFTADPRTGTLFARPLAYLEP